MNSLINKLKRTSLGCRFLVFFFKLGQTHQMELIVEMKPKSYQVWFAIVTLIANRQLK